MSGCARQPKPRTPPPVPKEIPQALRAEYVAQARGIVLESARGEDEFLRAHAIEAIQNNLSGEEAEAVVSIALDDPSPIVRFAAGLAAGTLKLNPLRQQLLNRADDPDTHVRIAVRYALHRLGDTRRSRDLERTAASDNPGVRANTTLVLGMLGERSALQMLRILLHDVDPAVRLQAAEAMWKLGDREGLAFLIASGLSAFWDDQMVALLALAQPRDQRVRQHVRTGLTADYIEVRLVAARAMGMLGSDEGYGIARNGARSKDPRQRQLAALAFGAIGRNDAQQTLAGLMKDADAEVRLAAASAMLQLAKENAGEE